MVRNAILSAIFFYGFAVTVLSLAHDDTKLSRSFRHSLPNERIQPNHLLDKELINTEEVDLRSNPICSWPLATHYMNGADEVIFTSPNYPASYPHRQHCGWIFKGNTDDILIKIKCLTFKLQKRVRNSCRDYLSLNGDKFCGEEIRPSTTSISYSNSATVIFHSNRRKNAQGFNCTATALKTSTSTTSTTSTSKAKTIACGVPNRSAKIVGGISTEENEYPWQVALAFPGNNDFHNFYCGGSIINERWILTAAHCQVVLGEQVIVGAHNWDNPPASARRVNITDVINHENYNSGTLDHDVAVVKVAEDLDFSDVGLTPVCLPTLAEMNNFAGWKATVTGWGKLNYTGSLWPDELQEVEVDVVTNALCAADYTPSEITENMLCAGIDEGGKDACQGDSGGPLMIYETGSYTQIGIVSWGYGCAHEHYYGVHARVTNHMTWIASKVGTVYHA